MKRRRHLSDDELHSGLRAQAVAVTQGALTSEEFLAWVHEEVGHDGPDVYQDLVEMECIPPLHDAGRGEWSASSLEALPLREWVADSIDRLARGIPPQPLPHGWADAII